MKRKRWLRKMQRIVDAAASPILPTVTYRTLTVCFPDRTITLDGRKIHTESDCLSIPLLGGEAVFMSKGDMERVA